MLTKIYIGTVVIILDLIHVHFFHCQSLIIFRKHKSSSAQVDNIKKNLLVLGKGPTAGLDDTTIRAEAKYYINTFRSRTKICSSLYYNGGKFFVC